MKIGRSLTDLADELGRQADAKQDFLIPANEISIQSHDGAKGPISHTMGRHLFWLDELPHNQIASYLGIPQAYYNSLRNQVKTVRVPKVDEDTMKWCKESAIRELEREGKSDYPESEMKAAHKAYKDFSDSLFDVTVNKLFESKGAEPRLVRTLNNRMRAVLSDQYNPDFDNLEVYMMAAQAIEEAGLGADNVVSCEVTDRKLYLKVLCPRLTATIKADNLHSSGFLREPQLVQAGFVLSNSEVGLGSLSIKLLLFKLVCTNGFVIEDQFKQRHVGKTLESLDDGTLYSNDTRKADAKARLLKLRDSIKATLDEAKFFSLIDRIQETTTMRFDVGVEKIVERTGQRFGLTLEERTDVFANLIEGADLSLWGLSNAVTATAQTVKSYDRASELEALGGRLLLMPDREMREFVSAASSPVALR